MFEPLRRKHAMDATARLVAHVDVTSLEPHAEYLLRRDHLPELDFLLAAGDPGRTVALAEIRGHAGATVEDDLRMLDRPCRRPASARCSGT